MGHMNTNVIVVTVIQDDRTTRERFSNSESAEKWISYKKNVEH